MSGEPVGRPCWCGAKTARAKFSATLESGATFHYVECEGCGVLAEWPQLAGEELAHYYAADYYGATRKKFVGPVATLVEYFQGSRARLAAEHLAAGAKILDVGCGNGGFLVQMKRRGFAVEGTEWTEASAARIAAEEGIKVHVGDLTSLTLAATSYDAISLWHVFEHVPAPDATLAAIARLLKPGGVLLLAMPNQESWQSGLYGQHWFHLDPPRHLFGFGPRSLRKALDQHGFSVLSQSTLSLEQNPYGALQSQLNALGFSRERAYETLKGTSKNGAGAKALDYVMLALLAGPALFFALIETAVGRGGTMTLVCRKSG
ncbi:class I SAM-dependent methyltransferase [soil metagenome]